MPDATRIVLLTLLAALLSACNLTSRDDANDGRLHVTTTINILTDLVQQVGGEHVHVTGLMGPGVDPHLYKASAGDVRKLANADITFYGGLHLEGKMTDILHKLTRYHPSHAVFEAIPENRLLAADDGYAHDPHVWFDVTLYKHAVSAVQAGLSQADPQNAAAYARNADAYRARLDALDTWIQQQVARVPENQRVMITAHDAFGYFGHRYGIEVRGLQGISTAAEAGTRDVRDLAALVTQRRIPAVFVETSVPHRTVEAVIQAARARGHDLRLGGELYADSAGAAGTPQGTYEGMLRHNVNTIVRALTPTPAAESERPGEP